MTAAIVEREGEGARDKEGDEKEAARRRKESTVEPPYNALSYNTDSYNAT